MEKVTLLNTVSPLEFLPNLSKNLGANIYIKRDDEGGRGGGGNKLRKYERIVGDALKKGCDTLIIAGHYQSNAARELVGVACQLGLKAIVVCKELIPQQNALFSQSGNALLMSLMNTKIIDIGNNDDFITTMDKAAESVTAEGGKPYLIPFGGSNLLGSLGYIDCAEEVIEQFKQYSAKPIDHIIVPVGSGGTQAGLTAGFYLQKQPTKVSGISVLHNKIKAHAIVNSLTQEILTHFNMNIEEALINVADDYVGEGYGLVTPDGIEAIKLTAQLEGLFLCPVYTGKAMSGLIDFIKTNKIKQGENVVFIHTGGAPLVHAYYDKFS